MLTPSLRIKGLIVLAAGLAMTMVSGCTPAAPAAARADPAHANVLSARRAIIAGPVPSAAALIAAKASVDPQHFSAWFGAPDSARREARGALWTYRLDHCAIVAIFVLSAADIPSLAAIEAFPQREDEPQPKLDQCLRAAAAREAGRGEGGRSLSQRSSHETTGLVALRD